MVFGSCFQVDYSLNSDFVNQTASKFKWENLSEDTVMDIGCGKELHCALAIYDRFPEVKSIIAIDACPLVIEETKNIKKYPQITTLLANILYRDAISLYEGKIDKIISVNAIHQIHDKQQLFRNVYELLKPGGQAAFHFRSNFALYHVLEDLRLDSKYKDYYKGADVMNFYSIYLNVEQYIKMLEAAGFQDIEIEDEKDYLPQESSQAIQVNIAALIDEAFMAPPELVKEMNNSAFNIYASNFHHQNSWYIGENMSIFVTKPIDWSALCTIS